MTTKIKNTIDYKYQSYKVDKVNTSDVSENDGHVMITVISISDRGTEIDPEILPRLFTKITTISNQDTGPGLYKLRNIIESYGGQIWTHYNYDGKKGATIPLVYQ